MTQFWAVGVISDIRLSQSQFAGDMPRSWSQFAGDMPRSQSDSPATNGLSEWYDALRRKPSLLSSSLSTSPSSSVTSSCSRMSLSSDPDSEDVEVDNYEVPEAEPCVVHTGESEMFLCVTEWLSRVTGSHFPGTEAEEKSPINHRLAVRLDPYSSFCWESRERCEHQYEGGTDTCGRWDGEAVVRFEDGGELLGNWRNGTRNGRFLLTSPAAGIRQLRGHYKNGKLSGLGRVDYESHSVEGSFRDGCLHGLARLTDQGSSNILIGKPSI